jgi:hypothetical membrane protein
VTAIGATAVEAAVDSLAAPDPSAPGRGGNRRSRRLLATFATGSALLLVWFALLVPNQLGRLIPSEFIRVPIEGLVVVAVALLLPARARQILAVTVGILLGVLTLLRLLDMGFYAELDRPFNPITDWGYVAPAVGVLTDSIGWTGAAASVAAVVLFSLALAVLTPLSVMRLTRLAARRRAASIRWLAVLAAVWLVCAVSGLQLAKGTPIAATTAAGFAQGEVNLIRADLRDEQTFAKSADGDAFHNVPGDHLLNGLRGKDVIIAFVESYGRVAVQDSTFSPPIAALLKAGTQRLQAAGFASRSAFLTSPTFGGISWLAHSTLQSGQWISNQQRYDSLVAGDRFTISDAFKRAGWRTVDDVPSNFNDWPVGKSFYHYDEIYDGRNVGYQGPKFSYASMPDQYTLSTFQRLELAKPGHSPVMAEIDLVSSHTPWAPLPRMVDWIQVGNGSVFDPMPDQGSSASVVWQDHNAVRAAYGQSIQYSLGTLISFVQNFHDDNLVMIVLGDHQPATIVTGQGASHDVPITIIAHDQTVVNRIAGWGWQAGMLPGPTAPVWPMDAFRDRFLNAFRK